MVSLILVIVSVAFFLGHPVSLVSHKQNTLNNKSYPFKIITFWRQKAYQINHGLGIFSHKNIMHHSSQIQSVNFTTTTKIINNRQLVKSTSKPICETFFPIINQCTCLLVWLSYNHYISPCCYGNTICPSHQYNIRCVTWLSNLYPFHIKPIMRSQMRFENNALWCEGSGAALFDTGVRKAAFDMGGLLLPREVFWKRILAKSRSLRRCGCQCERVHRIMRREKRLWTASCIDGKHSISLRFFKPHSPKYRDPTLGVKANRSAPECSDSSVD